MRYIKFLLPGIFILALLVRFLYFPHNVNFAYDQARDFFASLEILKGDLKIIGPPSSSSDQIFHGVLYYYLLAPLLKIFNGSPEAVAAVFKILNALGIFLVFLIAKNIFNQYVGLIAALLFALSFEQSQYSLFLGHPALAVISMLLFYLGLSFLIFKNQPKGLIVSAIGLGLSIQSEIANSAFFLLLPIFGSFFFKNFKQINFKSLSLSAVAFLITTSSFILSEFKYSFRTSAALLNIGSSAGGNLMGKIEHFFVVVRKLINDNFLSDQLFIVTLFFLGASFYILFSKKEYGLKGVFLIIWFLGGMIIQFLSASFSYYFSPATTVSLLILLSFLIYTLSKKSLILAGLLILLIAFNNMSQVITQNDKGPSSDIVIQPGMLTSNQRQALDYMYQSANTSPFAVSAITVPLDVKTTWDYLFNWIGFQKYNYLPIWGHEAASGFPGTLKVETDRAKLPQKRFVIIEPTVGIEEHHLENFLKEESYFSKVIEEKKFGTILVQQREKI